MNNRTKDAAFNWWKHLSETNSAGYVEYALKYAEIIDHAKPREMTESAVLSAWIHEVVLPWWNLKGQPFQMKIDWEEVMRGESGHCIAVLYLKEHDATETKS